jgi:hypothetical protein
VKKRIPALVLVLVLCAFPFSTYAAGTPKTIPKTIDERAAALEETYGVTITGYDVEITTSGVVAQYIETPLAAEYWDAHLTTLESGLAYLGASLTHKIRGSVSANRFEIHLCGVPRDRAQGFGGVETSPDGNIAKMVLFHGAKEATVLHEAGHLVDQLSTGEAAWASLYKPWSETEAGGDFISGYAKTFAWENYAECFEYGVLNGRGSPCPYPADNQVYTCCKAVFDDLVSFAGYGSRATRRMAGYLGIDIPQGSV